MRMFALVLIVSLSLIFLQDFYIYQQVKKRLQKPFLRMFFWLPALFFTMVFLTIRFGGGSLNTHHQYMSYFTWLLLAFVIFYIPKIFYILFDLLNKLLCLIIKKKVHLFSYIGMGLGALFIVLFIYGTFVTRFDFQVNTVEVEAENLPAAFDGFRIVQISDTHLGNWNKNYQAMDTVSKLIMQQKPDMIVMTGDLVSNYADETDGWKPSFSTLKAPYGVYAIMGNHDYGDYSPWKTPQDKLNNLIAVHNAYQNLGFTLLLDSTAIINKGGAQIGLIGMENWGHPPFPRYGKLQKAKRGSEKMAFNILLSHDPNHWNAEVTGKENITLTLAGHTHGMQMGIDKWGIKFSPAQWVFKQWKGLYKEGNQYIYVNEGIGYVGIPCRVGIRPEITVLILKRKVK